MKIFVQSTYTWSVAMHVDIKQQCACGRVAALQSSHRDSTILKRQHVLGFYTFSSKCRESIKLTAHSFDPK